MAYRPRSVAGAAAPPGRGHAQGQEPFVVQDLVIRAETTRYLRARYALPEGGSVLAPFPAGVLPREGGPFGANLVTSILDQYHQAQSTEPLLFAQLGDYGSDIAAGQLHCLLTENKDDFHQEKAEVLPAGLGVSSYIGVDDTGARHQGHHGYCTAIGTDLFSYFQSSASKSRLNFLQVRHGARRRYVLHEMPLRYWARQHVSAAVVPQRTQGPREFASAADWQARLSALGITGARQVRLATEGALLGGLVAGGVSPTLGVLSEGAEQFDLFVPGACWVHAERPLTKLVPHNEAHRVAIDKVRTSIGELYQELKAYRAQPDAARRSDLEARFDALVGQRPGYPSIDGVLRDLREHKADLLRVLERAGQAPAQQRPGVRHPRVRQAPQDQWRHAPRRGSPLPGHVCQLEEDLPPAGPALLGLAARSGWRPGPSPPPGRADLSEGQRGARQKSRSRTRRTE
jgi:hypothetical protein